MALDAATLALTAAELKATLTDAKIAKIFEPTRDELVITLRTRTDTYALLLSARSGSARVCLTEETFENPETPPSFCMLMRKHLTGGRLLDVHMEPGDRIVYFDFQCTNEMGDLVRNTLCAELMGRYSNLVLVQSGKIIDALKRVDFEDSDVRQLLPGLPYTTPPKPARPDFLLVSSASIVAAACQRELPVADALNKTVAGVGPVVCREAAWRAFDGEHLPANELTDTQKRSLMAAIDELKELHAQGGCPCSVTAPDGKPVEYTFFRPQQYGEQYTIREWPSFNAMLEGYYAEKDRAERLRTKSKELHKAVHNMYERAVRKQAARQEELAGKSPGDLFPQEAADKLQAGIERKIKEPSFDGVELALPGPDGKEHLYRVSLYVFLDRQEQEAAKEAPLPGSVVAIFKDITRFRRQAQKAQERQQHLMEALVRAVEYVDPNLVGHTRKMRHVAELLARHMELDDTAVLTLRMASQLSQIGKIFVPHHLLRKSGKLTPEEQQAVLQSSEYAFRVLYGINFGLPVPEALHDMNEKFDGSGPRALKGDQINPHARLLAVVNAFCSMVSDRAYRQGMPIEQALDILSSSPAFDPAMVLALREIPADDLRSALAGEDAPSQA